MADRIETPAGRAEDQMKRNIFLTALICAGMVLSCSSGTRKQNSAEPDIKAETAENKVNLADYNLPVFEGAFVVRDGKFEEIAAGSLNYLMQTNADRGFGFGHPVGISLAQNVQKFSVLHPEMNVAQIQVTSFKGIAVNSGHWFDPVDNTNVAWIPERNLAIDLNVIDSESGFAEIRLKEDLVPGFYVIHDDSFLRSRVSSDVTSYYPFIVLASEEKSSWESEADKCFAPFIQKYGDVISLDNIDELDAKSLKKCENLQRVAWKYMLDDEEISQQFKARTIYLSRLLDSGDTDMHRALLDTMDLKKSGLLQQLWQIEQNDLIQRLAKLQSLSSVGGDLPPLLVQLVVDSIQFQSGSVLERSVNVAELAVDPLMMISWVPFAHCSSDDPAITALWEAILNKKPVEKLLIDLTGAIQYHQLFQIIQKNTGLASWFKQIETNVPMSFKSRAASLNFRNNGSSIVIGPCLFSGVLPSEQSSWCATLKAKEKDLKSCFPNNYNGQNTIMILEQPLNGVSLGHEAKGTLRDPIDTQRAKPVISPEITDCILNVFAQIPASPSLDTTQIAKVAVTIGSK